MKSTRFIDTSTISYHFGVGDLRYVCEEDLSAAIGAVWLQIVGCYDYGALTAYLLRRFGPPNVDPTGSDHHKHGAMWIVPTPHPHLLLEIEPKPLPKDFLTLQNAGSSEAPRSLYWCGIFRLCADGPVKFSDKEAVDRALRATVNDLNRATNWRDAYGSPAGAQRDPTDLTLLAPYFNPESDDKENGTNVTTKLRSKESYAMTEARKRLVDFLSVTIEGRKDDTFAPYRPNEDDDYYWTLDSGNNWKVKFLPDEPNCFEVIHRYQCAANPFEQALAAWLVVRLGLEIA